MILVVYEQFSQIPVTIQPPEINVKNKSPDNLRISWYSGIL